MGIVMVLAGVVASVIFFFADQWWCLSASAICTVLSLWTFGLMHNHAVRAASYRQSYRGGFRDLTSAEVESVPDGLALLNLLTSLACIALLIYSLWSR